MKIHSSDIPVSPKPAAELDQLGDEIAELSAHLEAATARLLDLIREFDLRGGWNGGFRSCAAWLSWRVGLDLGAAREIRDLLRYEVAKLFHRRLPGPWLPEEDVANAKAPITRFTHGEPTAADRENIARNWQGKEATRDLQHEIAATLGSREKAVEQIFEAFLTANRIEAEKIGRIVLADALDGFAPGDKRDEIKFALRRWKKCPTLAAAIRVNLFIYRAVKAGTKLRHDCWDDLKQCINAAYVDVFVTGDKKLAEMFLEIRPGSRIESTENFFRQLGLSSSTPSSKIAVQR